MFKRVEIFVRNRSVGEGPLELSYISDISTSADGDWLMFAGERGKVLYLRKEDVVTFITHALEDEPELPLETKEQTEKVDPTVP